MYSPSVSAYMTRRFHLTFLVTCIVISVHKKTHAIQHAISQAIFSEMNEIAMVNNNAISARDINMTKHVKCVIRRSDHFIVFMLALQDN